MEQQEATTIDLTADDEPVAIDSVSHTQDGRGAPPPPPAGMPPMPPLRRSENSESDSSLPDFAAASSSESESEGRPHVAPPLEAALRGLTPRMPPLRRSASSASDSSLPDLASASSSASEAESEGTFNLPRLARGQAGSAAFWAGVDNWRRESGITEPRSPEEVPLPRPVPFRLAAMAFTPCQRRDARNSKLGESYHMPERGGVRNRRRAKSCTP